LPNIISHDHNFGCNNTKTLKEYLIMGPALKLPEEPDLKNFTSLFYSLFTKFYSLFTNLSYLFNYFIFLYIATI